VSGVAAFRLPRLLVGPGARRGIAGLLAVSGGTMRQYTAPAHTLGGAPPILAVPTTTEQAIASGSPAHKPVEPAPSEIAALYAGLYR